jgi:hypothetical protein
MTLGGGPMVMTVTEAEVWCNKNTSCHGFTYLTADQVHMHTDWLHI